MSKQGTINSERAFSNPSHIYYRTTQDIGFLPAGTIFVHDEEDTLYGSMAQGCLKLCWTPSGNCFGNGEQMICGGTVIFHYSFAEKSGLFEKVEPAQTEMEILKDQIARLERRCNELQTMILNKH